LNKFDEVFENISECMRGLVDWDKVKEEISEELMSVKASSQPYIYQIELTNACNLKCEFCPRTQEISKGTFNRKIEVMSFTDFVSIMEKITNQRCVEIFGFGETLLVPEVEKYISYLTSRNILTVLATNLVATDESKLLKAIDAGLSYMIIDFDALNETDYVKARPGGDFEKLVRLTKFVLAQAPRPYVVIQNIQGVASYTKEAFYDLVGIMPEEFRNRYFESFRGINFPTPTMEPADFCKEPFYGFSVLVNGDVVPCNRDWNGTHVMGNILEQTLDEVWNSPAFIKFRDEMFSTQKPALCQNCSGYCQFNGRKQGILQVNMFKGNFV
jgi:radical SAM protein with 4Fe4S-binding SPASM domain